MKYKHENKHKVVVFDLDGTLIDSKKKLQIDVIEAFERLGRHIVPEQITENWYELVDSYGINRENFDKAFDQRKSWEQSLRDGDIPIFPETCRVLDELKNKGIRMNLLSKSIPEYTKTKLDYFDLAKYFEQTATVHPKEPSKIQGASEIIEKLDPLTIQRAYFIGDKEEDVSVAKDINRKYKISTEGIYVDRNGEQLGGCHNVRSLEGILDII